jgi:hypothetical protein
LITSGRVAATVDGLTLDVSPRGVGVTFPRERLQELESLLETLVEDRLPLEITLRLPQGSVTATGQLVWWGLLGEPGDLSIRAGILLRDDWPEADWKLIQKNLEP